VDTLALMQVDDAVALKVAFAKRGEELREALRRGRAWFGAGDSLPERLAALMAGDAPSVWTHIPAKHAVPEPVRVVDAVLEPERSLPAQERTETSPAPVPVVAPSVVLATPVQQQEGVLAPALSGNGRKSTLVFGLADHILLVRRRRSRPQNASPRPKNRTTVQSIPGITEGSEPPDTEVAGVMTLSLWDLAEPQHEDAAAMSLPVPATLRQSTLWAQ
jgi:hypothetical protein